MSTSNNPLPIILDAAGLNATDPNTASHPCVQPLFGLSEAQLAEALQAFELPPWRLRQIRHALYAQRIEHWDEATALPQSLRQELAKAGFEPGLLKIKQTFHSVDGTERYLIAGHDGQSVETVWMPGGDGGDTGNGSEGAEADQEPETKAEASAYSYQRATLCISSQIGCAVNCQFCLTARLGIVRNLTAGEIAGQVLAVLRRHKVELGRDRINLVFMGMGEPFLNYDNFMAAVRLLESEVGIPTSRMTVSTSGIVPGILRLAEEPVRPRLAISLNAPSDPIRAEVMPINRKWSIDDVLDAVRRVRLAPRERITFEYVLLGQVNDQPQHAEQLVRLLRKANLPLKVNLIVWNPGPDVPYTMPQPEDVAYFQQYLIENGVPAYLRRPRGRDIYAACGQLKRTESAS